jgi:lantibiotic modifying enzyme
MDASASVRWQPLLDGDPAEAARSAIEDIAAALAAEAMIPDRPYLSGGGAGRALLYAYLAEAWPDRGFDDLAVAHLDRAIDQMAEHTMRAELYGGITGIAWVAEHLQGADGDDEDPNRAVDEVLLDYLGATPWSGDYDVISGLAGCGIYALERLPRAIAVEALTRVVTRLSELAVHTDAGISWRRRPEMLLPETRLQCPDGLYDLGVAHGVPGVLAVLAGAQAAGVAAALAAPLLDGAWRWMMAHRAPPDAETAFPYTIGGPPRVPVRSAWCYGDPGIACAMHAAAQRAGNQAWIDDALAIARRAAVRPAERSGCVDAGLCHGTAGLAHIYNRLWQATGEPGFGDAARLWCRQTLELRRPDKGIAGFQAYHRALVPGQPDGWLDDSSFLTGAAGTALALLAAISPVEPAWDRLLLLSLAWPLRARVVSPGDRRPRR